VTAHNGFGSHPHRDQEIFSYVVDGQLTHQDSEGHKETLGRGAVQYMSAGTGVWHSEMNEGDETCRFLQVCDKLRARQRLTCTDDTDMDHSPEKGLACAVWLAHLHGGAEEEQTAASDRRAQ
jgi:redox-sensitive bicupin YhaK (pirin superfamily)